MELFIVGEAARVLKVRRETSGATLKGDNCKRLLYLVGITGYGKGTYKNY